MRQKFISVWDKTLLAATSVGRVVSIWQYALLALVVFALFGVIMTLSSEGTTEWSLLISSLPLSEKLHILLEACLDSEKFGTCLKENQQLETVKKAVAKTSQTLPYGSGVPYFKINSFESSGFAGEYKDVQRMMRAGGVQ